MSYESESAARFAFGQKTARFTPGLFRALSRAGATAARGGAAVGRGAANYGVPLGAGGAAGYGFYTNTVPADATPAEKVEGAVAAGLLGLGAGSFANPRQWRNAHLKARHGAMTQGQTTLSGRKLSPDYWSNMLDNVKKDIVMPKAQFAGLSLVPAGAMQVQHTLRNVGEATGNVNEATKQIADLASDVNKTDTAGKSVIDNIRNMVNQVSGDASNISSTVSTATGDIAKSLTEAAKSTQGAAGAAEGVAKAVEPLGAVAGELTKKDQSGKSVIANLSHLLSNMGEFTDPKNDKLRSALNPFRGVGEYAPYLGGGLAGAAGLYALYKMLAGRKKKERPEYKFAAEKVALNPAYIAPVAGALLGGGLGGVSGLVDPGVDQTGKRKNRLLAALDNALIGAGVGGAAGAGAEFFLPGLGLGGKYRMQDMRGPGEKSRAIPRMQEVGMEMARRQNAQMLGLRMTGYQPEQILAEGGAEQGKELAQQGAAALRAGASKVLGFFGGK